MTSATPGRPKTYRGEELRAVAMPLGGIGTGSVAICGDGSLRQWQLQNQVNHMACLPHSFFAVWARQHRPPNEPVARVLQSAALYDHDGPPPPPTSNDHVVPMPHRRLLQRLPGVAATEFTGGYPIAEVSYHDSALPLTVELEAFSPFAPLDSKHSGLPLVVFNLTVANPTERAMLASVAASVQNAVGWDSVAPIFDTKCQLYGGNVNSLIRAGGATMISMSNTRLEEDHPGYGSLALAALSSDASYLTQWDDLHGFWEDFRADGRLSNVADTTPSVAGKTWNGALAVSGALQPGESRTVTFTLAWHFPNRYVNFSQRAYFGAEDRRTKFWLGNRYNLWFQSAVDVAEYAHDRLGELTSQTRLARDIFYDSTLPYSLIDAVTSQVSILRSPTCFWTEDLRFYGFEGCNGASTPQSEPVGGCCPMNCTHVWNYEMALARLFPDLERSMRETEWDIQQHPSGYLPHRVLLPTFLPRTWDRTIGGPANPALDGLLGAVLKTYREYRACGDRDWLGHHWPAVRRAIEHVWSVHDLERSGAIAGEQPNTYDISIYGLNTFIGTLYLAALRAAEAMATIGGEAAFAAECRVVFERGSVVLERLWNDEYYVQEVDLDAHPDQAWATGCHADHLLGEWWAHGLDLGPLLDREHVRTAAKSIYRHNFRHDFRDFVQRPRAFVTEEDEGLLVCTWPRGGRPQAPTQYSDEVWTGIEYEVAALLLYEGETEAALKIVEAVRARYDGRKQSPWNDVECGDHYVRAMASWSLLEAASGYRYDAGAAEIGFAPALTPEAFRAPFVARDGWGTFAQTIADDGALDARVRVASGSLTVHRLRLATRVKATKVTATTDGTERAATVSVHDGEAGVEFGEAVTIAAGQTLGVVLS
ncbi:MAG: GH116 family glycosyl-hydrolase [Thermomicrobiales bacterium]